MDVITRAIKSQLKTVEYYGEVYASIKHVGVARRGSRCVVATPAPGAKPRKGNSRYWTNVQRMNYLRSLGVDCTRQDAKRLARRTRRDCDNWYCINPKHRSAY